MGGRGSEAARCAGSLWGYYRYVLLRSVTKLGTQLDQISTYFKTML